MTSALGQAPWLRKVRACSGECRVWREAQARVARAETRLAVIATEEDTEDAEQTSQNAGRPLRSLIAFGKN
jgi:hypothetical protein